MQDEFSEAGEEAGCRGYGGMHYKKSIEVGFSYRKKVADNIKSTLKFVK